MASLLELVSVTMRFGGVTALSEVDLSVEEGEILGLIGPNGAGKTTVFNVVTGVFSPTRGDVRLDGRSIAGEKRYRITRAGVARTFQNIRLFPEMTARENVMVGADRHAKAGFLSGLLALPRSAKEERALRDRAMGVLAELGIAEYAGRLPTSLPYPIRKRVALARALVSEPELLLLDEPASGLSNDEMAELGELIRGLTDRMSVMLVEHHMDLVMSVCDVITVLDFGKVIAHGTPDQVRNDPAVLAAYLGDDADGGH